MGELTAVTAIQLLFMALDRFSYCKSIRTGLLCCESIKNAENQNILFED
jgi:hypothetical protein